MESIREYYLNNGFYDSCYEELQYLAEFHSYRLPSIRVVKEDRKSGLLMNFRKYMDNNFGGWNSNIYNSKYMSGKDKIVLILLDLKKYKILNLIFKGN